MHRDLLTLRQCVDPTAKLFNVNEKMDTKACREAVSSDLPSFRYTFICRRIPRY